MKMEDTMATKRNAHPLEYSSVEERKGVERRKIDNRGASAIPGTVASGVEKT
jgi:hypothetical protein